MNNTDMRSVIERYLAAYNAFDIDSMMDMLHPDIRFENISNGEINAAAYGTKEFRQLAEISKRLFSSRKQTMIRFEADKDQAFIEISYEGILASDIPNGMKAGETLRLNGRSEFSFQDGKICRITDIS